MKDRDDSPNFKYAIALVLFYLCGLRLMAGEIPTDAPVLDRCAGEPSVYWEADAAMVNASMSEELTLGAAGAWDNGAGYPNVQPADP